MKLTQQAMLVSGSQFELVLSTSDCFFDHFFVLYSQRIAMKSRNVQPGGGCAVIHNAEGFGWTIARVRCFQRVLIGDEF